MHALNDAKDLASSAGAIEALDATRAKLQAIAVGASSQCIAAGEALLTALPGVDVNGEAYIVRAHDMKVPTAKELAEKFPEAFPAGATLTGETRARASAVFNGTVVKEYGPILPGLAHAADVALGAGVARLLAAEHCGDVNVAAALLLPVYHLFARDSAAADTLQRYFLKFTLLCDFHVLEAVKRKLSAVDADLREPVLDAFREVLFKGASWDAFKERFKDALSGVSVQLDTSESSDGAHLGLFQYFEKHWLSPRFRSLADGVFRSLVERFGINTTNDVELFW